MAAVDEAAARPRKERAENAAKRRRQLIDATLRSVVVNGLAQTTLATVAREAGLSQGVAVFYFANKRTLLAEALRAHYLDYRDTWRRALAAAGEDPVERVAALVRADFDAGVTSRDALAVWHAFWGEASARPIYAEIATEIDAEREREMRAAMQAILGDGPEAAESAALQAAAVDALTDGLWLRIYLSPESMDARRALAVTAELLSAIAPAHAAAFRRALAAPDFSSLDATKETI